MPEGKVETDPPLVEQWLQEQRKWQQTLLAYFDSMVKDDQFLTHLGNAMRGSLLAGKPYPTAAAAPAAQAADDRLDRVLFALNTLQGQLHDLTMTLDEIRRVLSPPPTTAGRASATPSRRQTGSKSRAKRDRARP